MADLAGKTIAKPKRATRNRDIAATPNVNNMRSIDRGVMAIRMVASGERSGARRLELAQTALAQGLSQEQLAVDASVDRTYVGGLERGTVNPSLAIIDRLARALSIHVSELFREPRKGSPPPMPMRGGRRPLMAR